MLACRRDTIRQGAQAPLLHSDDTHAQILSLRTTRSQLEAAGQSPSAKAINTSGIVAVLPDERKVVRLKIATKDRRPALTRMEYLGVAALDAAARAWV